jgi:DNA repair protein RadC
MGVDSALAICCSCGRVTPGVPPPPSIVTRPWHVRNRAALYDYVSSLGTETREWLLALYVDDDLRLLSVEAVAIGSVNECIVDLGEIFYRGRRVAASGLFLVHNHPSGDPRPSRADRLLTVKMARVLAELDMPLLDHFVIAGESMVGMMME